MNNNVLLVDIDGDHHQIVFKRGMATKVYRRTQRYYKMCKDASVVIPSGSGGYRDSKERVIKYLKITGRWAYI